jgi:hypothetical protein
MMARPESQPSLDTSHATACHSAEDVAVVSEYIEGMLRRVMVVVLLGCVGLTAGVAFGTVFSSNGIKASIPSIVLPAKGNCYNDWHPLASDVAPNIGVHHTFVKAPGLGGCVVHQMAPGIINDSAHFLPLRISSPSDGLPMGGYVLLGLIAGLSAALGFLVPPRSRLITR